MSEIGARHGNVKHLAEVTPAYNVWKPCDAYNAIVQGTWDYLIDTTQFLSGTIYNTSHTQNDEVIYKFTHRRGSFTLVLLCNTDTNRAIATITVDGVAQGTIDLYSAVPVKNVLRTLAVTIASDGTHTLSIKAATRNAAANDWYLTIGAWWIRD